MRAGDKVSGPRVSVIIATYERGMPLIDSIKSVLSADFHDLELIVVDQTQAQDVAVREFITSSQDERLRFFRVAPPSLPAARNFGLHTARGPVILYIDDDVLLDVDCISAHLEAYQDPQVWAVAGRVRGETEPESDTLYRLSFWGRRVGSMNVRDADRWTYAARGCNMSFRTEVLNAIGGFDTKLLGGAHREDTDISLRVRAAGGRIRFVSRASLLHLEAATGGVRGEDEGTLSVSAINNAYFGLKHFGGLRVAAWMFRAIIPLMFKFRFGALLKQVSVNRRVWRAAHERLRSNAQVVCTELDNKS